MSSRGHATSALRTSRSSWPRAFSTTTCATQVRQRGAPTWRPLQQGDVGRPGTPMMRSLLSGQLDDCGIGEEIFALAADMYPVCRSITGNGVRDTLRRLQRHVPLDTHEVPTGTAVFDWTVPREWNIRDAWVKNARGEKVIDFQKHSLHVLNYSMPFRGRLPLSELKAHLFTLPDHPDWIPYRTSYYKEAWGFCVAHRELE